MKIITENAVYVQRMDLSLIFRMMELDTIPESITLKVFGDETGTMADENSNKEEFVKFESDDEIDFFRNIDWIVDFNQVNNLSIDEIADMRRDTLRKRDRIGKLIYSLPTKEHIVNPKYIYTHMSLGYKAYHLENILWFKQGINRWGLWPKEIDDSLKGLKQTEEKGVKKFIKRIFKRTAK